MSEEPHWNISVTWVVTPYIMTDIIYHWAFSFAIFSSNLKVKAAGCSQAFVNIYKATRQKTAFFIVITVRTSKPTEFTRFRNKIFVYKLV
jgi:hypothetical protein